MLLRKKEEIINWLKKYEITNYEVIEDEKYGYVVNVNSFVNLNFNNLKNIGVKFNKIKGNFYCNYNSLKSLEGCPEIINGSFHCNSNKLTTLKYCPEIVTGRFNCSNNYLVSLKGCPKRIGEFFYCNENNITIEGLKYLPEEITGNLIYLLLNKKLGNFQIENFKELKEKVNIYFEKEKLQNIINKKDVKSNKNKANINKI